MTFKPGPIPNQGKGLQQTVIPPEVMELIPHPTLDPSGSATPSINSARNAVRHELRDGYPALDTVPVPFAMVRLEELTDQIPTSNPSVQTMFQVRFDDVPTQRYMNAQVVPTTLVAYVDNTWTPTTPTSDADTNGNFVLPVAPQNRLLVTYAWQYLSDGEINQFVDIARQWLREFQSVSSVPDGLVPALVSYASSRALQALSRTAILAQVRAGDSEVDWSSIGKQYSAQAMTLYKRAIDERLAYYSQGPEALDPTVVDVYAPVFPPYTPER